MPDSENVPPLVKPIRGYSIYGRPGQTKNALAFQNPVDVQTRLDLLESGMVRLDLPTWKETTS